MDPDSALELEVPEVASQHTRFIERVILRNYKSIAACDVTLSKLTYLVGPNGSGKSNFLDALRFVTDSLQSSLDHALRDRGGSRRSVGVRRAIPGTSASGSISDSPMGRGGTTPS
ncbi:MAG TPA: AAA family ATPase [Longimicrobiaceae bacterium]|nr:AAA family ATPase [Longimicrobiaceae bacterium]